MNNREIKRPKLLPQINYSFSLQNTHIESRTSVKQTPTYTIPAHVHVSISLIV